jgi:hypothetical protein
MEAVLAYSARQRQANSGITSRIQTHPDRPIWDETAIDGGNEARFNPLTKPRVVLTPILLIFHVFTRDAAPATIRRGAVVLSRFTAISDVIALRPAMRL